MNPMDLLVVSIVINILLILLVITMASINYERKISSSPHIRSMARKNRRAKR